MCIVRRGNLQHKHTQTFKCAHCTKKFFIEADLRTHQRVCEHKKTHDARNALADADAGEPPGKDIRQAPENEGGSLKIFRQATADEDRPRMPLLRFKSPNMSFEERTLLLHQNSDDPLIGRVTNSQLLGIQEEDGGAAGAGASVGEAGDEHLLNNLVSQYLFDE